MQADKVAAHFDLTDKVILITGGSRGLGLEMGRAFAEARKFDACEQAAQTIQRETGQECLPVACHVGDWDACDALVEQSYAHFGRVDVLVNNAGMSPLYASLTDVSRELFDKVLAVNLAGPFRLSALVGERMVAGEGGSIINVSSIASLAPSPVEVPYGAAKAGVNNLTESLARAYAPKVRVNCIVPGLIETSVTQRGDPEELEALRAATPLRRLGKPRDVANAALFLASDEADHITGQLLAVSGGVWPAL